MKKLIPALALAGVFLGGCANTSQEVPPACVDALEAADDIITASKDVFISQGHVLEAIPDAILDASMFRTAGVDNLTQKLKDSSPALKNASKIVSESQYDMLKEACLTGG